MFSWVILWDVVKVAVFPVLGLLYAVFKQKFAKVDDDIEKLRVINSNLEKKIIKMEASFVTQDELRDLFANLATNIEKGNTTLESRIEKTMDLKISPIKDMLIKLVDKK